jgi:DNA polymerase V
MTATVRTKKQITIHPINTHDTGPIVSFAESLISAGFPSSAENFLEKTLDLHELLVTHPASTFFIRVHGDSMIDAGILSGDILIVDRSLSVSNNRIIVARINDEFVVKRIIFKQDAIILAAENAHYPPIHINGDIDFEVWGIVTFIIHRAT